MKKTVLLLLALLSLSVYAYSKNITDELENSLLRLHIIAESNSEYDQSVKLAVRNSVLAAVKDISIKDEEIFRKTAEIAANDYLSENDIPYRAKALYGKFEFPRKKYKNITLPKGEYYGIKIILGNGGGENWWCVMYPPLCIADDGEAYIDSKSDSVLKNELNQSSYSYVTEKKIKFRILEFFKEMV